MYTDLVDMYRTDFRVESSNIFILTITILVTNILFRIIFVQVLHSTLDLSIAQVLTTDVTFFMFYVMSTKE